jgi:hypothetical protein
LFRISGESPIQDGLRKKPSSMSPIKKEISMAKRPGGSKADMLSAADGPKGSMNAANSENSIFNKHYNKELKLCEGKPYYNLIIIL